MSNVVTFGIIEKADVTPKDLEGITLPLPGEHIIYDALAAVAVAKIMGLKRSSVKKGLENAVLSSKRMEIINRRDNVKIINDTYNANPQSMAAALKVLASLKGRKIAVLGDMFELGGAAKRSHRSIGKLARELKIDILISVGKLSREMQADHHYPDNRSAAGKLKKLLKKGDRVLIKGSRGMKMEEISSALSKKPIGSILLEKSFG